MASGIETSTAPLASTLADATLLAIQGNAIVRVPQDIAEAEARKTVYLDRFLQAPEATYDLCFERAYAVSNDVAIPPGASLALSSSFPGFNLGTGQTLHGPGELVFPPGAQPIRCNGGRITIEGVRFRATVDANITFITVAGDECMIDGCRFAFLGGNGNGVYILQGVGRNTVQNCNQREGQCMVFAICSDENVIIGNQSVNARRSILFYGGSHNTIIGNRCAGGTTGIANLAFRTGGTKSAMIGNTVSGNVLIGVAEESISFDCNGNSADNRLDNGVLSIATVASVTDLSATQERINISETTGVASWANNYAVIALSGNAIGRVMRAEASASTSITVSKSGGTVGAFLTAGDKLLITLGVIANVVANNTITGDGQSGIAFWGHAWHNKIADNTITDYTACKPSTTDLGAAIRTVSVIGGSAASTVQGFSGFNTIADNTIRLYKAATADTGTGREIEVFTQRYGGIISVPRNPGSVVSRNNAATQKGIYVNDAYASTVDDNRLAGGGTITLEDTTNLAYGHNMAGAAYCSPTLLGTNTGLSEAYGAAVADMAGTETLAQTQAKVNALLASLRAAGQLKP